MPNDYGLLLAQEQYDRQEPPEPLADLLPESKDENENNQ
jgi:hypothetical protein